MPLPPLRPLKASQVWLPKYHGPVTHAMEGVEFVSLSVYRYFEVHVFVVIWAVEESMIIFLPGIFAGSPLPKLTKEPQNVSKEQRIDVSDNSA
jgi:hypothetical protein